MNAKIKDGELVNRKTAEKGKSRKTKMKVDDVVREMFNTQCTFGRPILALRRKDEKDEIEFIWGGDQFQEQLKSLLRKGWKPMFVIGIDVDLVLNSASCNVRRLPD